MTTLLVGRICRTCLLESSTMHKLLDSKKDSVQIAELLNMTVPNFDLFMEMDEDTPLPLEICSECLEKLHASYSFQQMCLFSNERLRTMVTPQDMKDLDMIKASGQSRENYENENNLQEIFKIEVNDELMTVVSFGDGTVKEVPTSNVECLQYNFKEGKLKEEPEQLDKNKNNDLINEMVCDTDDAYCPSNNEDHSESLLKMNAGKMLKEEDEIEKFLASCDDNGDLNDLDEELGSDDSLDEAVLLEEDVSSEEELVEEVNFEKELYKDDIPPNILPQNSSTISHSEKILGDKNHHKWSAKNGKLHHYAENIAHQRRGPTRSIKGVIDPVEIFRLFVTDEIIDEIVMWTNVEICHRRPNEEPTTSEEILALLGILTLTAAMKDNHLPTSDLFDAKYGGPKYLSTMTRNRFKLLMSCLRFDDKAMRLGLNSDKLAPIRKIWEMFIQRCRENYTPGLYVTIGEQLLAFGGKCGFKMHIPNKPAKLGLKIVMLCDSGTKYVTDAMPYLGANNSGLPLGEFYVKELTKTIYGSHRTVAISNWFTSVPLAKSLLKEPYKLTLVGTLKSNTKEIPSEIRDFKGRKCSTTMFCYDKELTLASYKPKPSKVIYMLSSCNNDGTVNNETNNPCMIDVYNSTKDCVDTFDHMCSSMSCSRKTNRWPTCLFFGMLNMSFINSYVIYTHNMFELRKKPLSRINFMKFLHSGLIQKTLNIRRKLLVLKSSEGGELNSDKSINCTKRKICAFCHYSKRRMTKSRCAQCKKSICGEHKIDLCASCIK